ncbi:predicted protein [Mycobacterium tuberculosis GM 1503]|nr:predicted protein [Mycobacterium tuberculosis GM 1503]
MFAGPHAVSQLTHLGFQRGDPLFEVLGQHERILPRFNATQPCPGRTPALGARRISRAERGSALLGSYLDKSGRAEVTIEGIRILDAFLSHHREARGIDERVLSLVVRTSHSHACSSRSAVTCSTRTTVLKRIAAAATAARDRSAG